MSKSIPQSVAFAKPGGENCRPARSRPLDLLHLNQQTMGDRRLEQEVLGLFMQQLRVIRDQIGAATADERLRLAHGLKGSARSIGAFAIADCAAAIEEAPADKRLLMRLAGLIDEVRDFIAAIHR